MLKQLACNMGKVDRVIRVSLAAGFLAIAFTTEHLSDSPFLLWGGVAFAAVNIFAASTAFCPMYVLTGHDTRSAEQKRG